MTGKILLSWHRVATTLALLLLLVNCKNKPAFPAEERFATRTAEAIVLHPTNISFRIPKNWLDWDQQFHNNLHLTRSEIEHVRDASGEWDTEYAQVVNAALPIEDCASHVGGEGWGEEGASFGDLQMRAYILDRDPSAIIRNIETTGKIAADKVSKNGSSMSTGHMEGWRSVVIDYPLWYGDYGGTATVQFYVRPIGGGSLVLVFMVAAGGQGQEEIKSILDSVSVPK